MEQWSNADYAHSAESASLQVKPGVEADRDGQHTPERLEQLVAVARGALVRRQFLAQQRREFVLRFGPTASSSGNNVELLGRCELLVERAIRPGDRADKSGELLTFLLIALTKSARSASAASSFGALLLSAEHARRASALIADLCARATVELAACKLDTNHSALVGSALIRYLAAFTSLASAPTFAADERNVAALKAHCKRFLVDLGEPPLYAHLTDALTRGLKGTKTALPSGILNELFVVIMRVTTTKGAVILTAIQQFVEHVLTAPALVSVLNQESLKHFGAAAFFPRIVACLVEHKATLFDLGRIATLNLTANIIHLSYHEQAAVVDNLYDWTVAMNALLARCQSSTSGMSGGGRATRLSYHHPILGWINERIDEGTEGTFVRVSLQLEFMWSRRIIDCLFGQVLACYELPLKQAASKCTQQQDLGDKSRLPTELVTKLFKKFKVVEAEDAQSELPPPSVAAVVCHLYQNVLLCLSYSQIDVLSALCRDERVLVKLWHFVTDNASGGLAFYARLLKNDASASLPHFAALHLFCDTAHSLISILDEDELYVQQTPFSLSQLCDIARFVNTLAFRCIYDKIINVDSPRGAALYNSLYQLCALLHNRDTRKAFTHSPSFWLASNVKPSAILNQYERHQANAVKLLQYMPWTIPLVDRVSLFRKLVQRDKKTTSGCTVITVDRRRIIEDSYRQLASLSSHALRSTVRVKFVNEQGLDEAGIDQEGLLKEHLELTLQKAFDPVLSLFKSTPTNLLYPSPNSSVHENHLSLFQFVGCLLAKAVYEGICFDAQLAPVLLANVLSKQLCAFDELAAFDPEIYKQLSFIKHYTGDVADLTLTFSYTEDYLGKLREVELMPGGSRCKVTNDNRIVYIHRMAQYRVITQTKQQCANFVAGFRSIIDAKWLSLFSTHELQILISGQTSDVDINDLRKHTQYYGGFSQNHRTIRWLWQILAEDFTSKVDPYVYLERRLFIKFCTSCSRPPLLGFAYLEPTFSVRCVETPDDQDQGDTLGSVIRGFLAIRRKQSMMRLPTAATCFNVLKLPNYGKKSVLLEKLRYAITAETGFELS